MAEAKSVENRALGKQIEAERIAADLSQREFAKRSGINYETFRRIADGSRDINITQIIGAARTAGITAEELVRRSLERVPQILQREMSEAQATNVVEFRKKPQEMTGAELDALTIDKAAVEYNDESTEPEADD